MSHHIRIVVLGEKAVGKSSFINAFVKRQMNQEYDPTVEEIVSADLIVDKKKYTLDILDTSGEELFIGQRKLYLSQAEAFLLVYSISKPSSLFKVIQLYHSLIAHRGTINCPIMLVGMQNDLELERQVLLDDGLSVSHELGVAFAEINRDDLVGILEIFVNLINQKIYLKSIDKSRFIRAKKNDMSHIKINHIKEDNGEIVSIRSRNNSTELIIPNTAESLNNNDEDNSIFKREIIGFSIGHFYNDLCACMWFTYLMVFLEKVQRFESSKAGFIMLVGQVGDSLSTILVGYLSDAGYIPSFLKRFGKRISWHMIGTVAVASSFSFIFSGCWFCKNSANSGFGATIYLLALILLFQFGWAAVQISHLALVPEMSSCHSVRNSMQSFRYAFSMIANVLVFCLLYTLFSRDKSPEVIDEGDLFSMAVLSKLFGDTLALNLLHGSCYEITHTWNPNCVGAIVDAVPGALQFSFKTYFPLYLIASLVSTKSFKKALNKKVLINSLRSTVFLTCNMIFLLYATCKLHQLLGFSTWLTLGYGSGLISSFLAILIENPHRRAALALYLTNQATETAYRQGIAHGYLPYIPYGQILPLAIGLAGLVYYNNKQQLPTFLSKVINFLLRTDKDQTFSNESLQKVSQITSFIKSLRKSSSKSDKCLHDHSCVSHIFEGSIKNFGYGLGVSTVINILTNAKTLISNPKEGVKNIFTLSLFKIPLFLSAMPTIFNTLQCSLNRFNLKEYSKYTPLISAAAASLAYPFFPNVSVALYIFWKLIEVFYEDMVNKGYFPKFKNWEVPLYSISTGYILGVAILEPQLLRPGYYAFLDKLTNTKLRLFNREYFDRIGNFGFNSNYLYQNTKIVLDPKYITINPLKYG
uniref:TMEM135_C_rich domain-containing protein n=1 Tax=Rhabditophanes sp. KR3021 TaxID=114890 RepID=A0AC35U5M5_9BILA